MSRLLLAAAAVLLALPLAVAITDGHLAGQSAALVISTAAAALAVSALALQPLLAGPGGCAGTACSGPSRSRLVLIHLGGLYVESAEDTLFALSLDGPTRGRMATLATAALIAVVALGVLRARLPMSGTTWRVLHGFLAALVVLLGFGHAVLTDGALDGVGTPVLLAFAAVALSGSRAPTRLGGGVPLDRALVVEPQHRDHVADVFVALDPAGGPALLVREDRVVGDAARVVELLPDGLGEAEVRGVVAVQVPELLAAEREAVLAAVCRCRPPRPATR